MKKTFDVDTKTYNINLTPYELTILRRYVEYQLSEELELLPIVENTRYAFLAKKEIDVCNDFLDYES